MTSAVDHFEPLLNIAPSSRTRKIQAANGDLEEKLDEANTLWAHTYPVPVRAGLHPFPEDHRFQHRSCQGLGALSGLDDDLSALDSAAIKTLHIPFPGPGYVRTRKASHIAWKLGANILVLSCW